MSDYLDQAKRWALSAATEMVASEMVGGSYALLAIAQAQIAVAELLSPDEPITPMRGARKFQGKITRATNFATGLDGALRGVEFALQFTDYVDEVGQLGVDVVNQFRELQNNVSKLGLELSARGFDCGLSGGNDGRLGHDGSPLVGSGPAVTGHSVGPSLGGVGGAAAPLAAPPADSAEAVPA